MCAGAGELVDDYELARRLGRWTLTGRVERKRDEADHLLGIFHVDKLHIGNFSAGRTGKWRNEVWRGRQEYRRGGRRPTKCGENLGAMSVESWDIRRYIVLDTGCTRTLVHDRLVPVGQKTSGSITICCGHEDEVTYPLWRFQ